MKLLPSIIRWMFLFAALAGIVAIVFHVVRYRPRCTLQITAIDTVQLTPDGGRLLIYGVPGPATVWDARSGALIHELLEERGLVATLLPSQRGSLAAAIVDNNQVWLIDWSSGEHWRSAGPQDPVEVRFSDSGSLLLVSTGMDDPKTFVFDVATKRRMLVAAGVCKHISSDERRLFMRKWPSRALSVMDIETAETVADLPLTTQDVSFSANGKRLVAGLHAMSVGPLDDPVTSPAPLSIYELTGGEFKQTPLKFDRNPLRCGVMSADGGILITWLTNADFTTNLDFVDAAAGRALASHALLEGEVRRRLRAKAAGGSLSLDGSLFGFVGREGRDDVLMMFDARTGRLLWKRTGVSEAIFLPGGEVVAYRPWVLRLFDSRTGDELHGLPRDIHTSPMARETPWPKPTLDGRHFHLQGTQTRNRLPFFWEAFIEKHIPGFFGVGKQVNVVVHTVTGRELFRVLDRGKHGVWLSDDGSTLVTADGEGRGDFALSVWDVHPRRAWTWAIGVAAGTWLCSWFLRQIWKKRRMRRAIAP